MTKRSARPHKEDEVSYVLKGKLGALLGDEAVIVPSGARVLKLRAQGHTFWTPCDTRCEIIEIISPAGLTNYFREVGAVWSDPAKFAEINEKYSLDMDFDCVPKLCERFGLTFPKF
jgi:hypothetical protein